MIKRIFLGILVFALTLSISAYYLEGKEFFLIIINFLTQFFSSVFQR